MSKRSSGNDGNQKPVGPRVSANNQKENTDRLIEMAAEQFAALLWQYLLYKKHSNSKKTRRR